MNAIQRIRRVHFAQFPVQATLMILLTLSAGHRLRSTTTTSSPAPAILALGLLLLIVGGCLYLVSKRIRPNLRRPEEQNRRLYLSGIILRNSFLGILGLPPLMIYHVTGHWLDLVFFAALLLFLCLLTAPTEPKYRQWLLR
jgi:protein-S-isoprenylcysteine O-methyltransferase Ste14